MPQYKFTYFDSRGIGEPIRQILTVSGVPFEDVRISTANFPLTPEKKEELGLEWGQLPLLEIDGEKKGQSYAIARYLAKKYNLAGKNEAEQFRCDEILEAVRDFFLKGHPLFLASQDIEKLEVVKKTFAEVDSPPFLKRFNDILERQGTTWLVGDSLTYVDIYMAHLISQFLLCFHLELTKNYPALSKLINAVQNHPKLKEWFEKRPKTMF